MRTAGRSARAWPTRSTGLDRILDGLADGLNEAVALAVKEAVTKAVEVAVREVLANAELQKRLRPEPISRPSTIGGSARMLWNGLVRVVRGCWNGAVALARCCRDKAMAGAALVCEGGDSLVRRLHRGMTRFARRVWLAGMVVLAVANRFRKPLVIALVVGMTVGLGCYMGGPSVASFVSGVGGFLVSLVASLLNRLRQLLLSRDQLQEWRFRRMA